MLLTRSPVGLLVTVARGGGASNWQRRLFAPGAYARGSVQRSPPTSASLQQSRPQRVDYGPSFVPIADVERNVH